MLSALSLLVLVAAEELLLPHGQLKLGARISDTPFSAVYLVTDEKDVHFNLRVGVTPSTVAEDVRRAFVAQFAAEINGYEEVTNAVCPGLVGSDGSSFKCDRRNLDVMLAKNVAIVDAVTGKPITIEQATITINDVDIEADIKEFESVTNSTASFLELKPNATEGVQMKLVIDFSKNILTPAFAGRSLAEEVSTNILYEELSNRFGLYVAALAELTESVRLMHSRGLVHLNLSPDSIMCTGIKWCERLLITSYARSRRTEGPVPDEAHEVYQAAVINDELYASADPRTTALAIVQKSKLQGWEDVKAVDWYALGGTLYYILAMDSASIDTLRDSPTKVSDFFLQNLAPQASTTTKTVKAVEAGVKKPVEATTPAPTAAAVAEVKKKITEGLLVLDGLLQEKRESRLNLDKQKRGVPTAQPSLRKGAAGFLEIRKMNVMTGVSCSEFVDKVARSSPLIVEHNLAESIGVASFLQDVC